MEISKETIVSLKEKGVKVITATHVLAGIDRAIRKKHGTWMISELIAETLRTFGQGTKVCAEIVMMAADSGILRVKEDVIAVGGTGRGADTAWVMKPAHSHQFFNLRFKELLCKPKEF
ncbi:MAG: pyruvate kinase alpha/beta domain-containing protein, partial [Candidatus Heimdallarchaeaceae archaeon]